MQIAALDLGTNTFLCLIAEVDDQGKITQVLHDEAQVVRLGQGMDANRSFHPEALKRADQCLQKFRQKIDELKVKKVMAVATSAARDAKNKDEFLQVAEKHQIPIHIIEGQKEAELTFLGGTYDFEETQGHVIVDVGGGSTEIIFQNEKGEIKGKSLDIGAVRLTERWVNSHPLSDESLANIQLNIQKELEIFQKEVLSTENVQIQKVIGVAGTPTTLTCLALQKDFVEEEVHGFLLSQERLHQFIQEMSAMDLESRLQLPGMQKGREDVIISGTMILLETLKLFAQTNMQVSTKGVRYGLAIHLATQGALGVI